MIFFILQMTSPSMKSQEKLNKDSKAVSTSSSDNVPLYTTSQLETNTGFFGWLRVFRFAHLMMKQGC